jgi:hypothetical protein
MDISNFKLLSERSIGSRVKFRGLCNRDLTGVIFAYDLASFRQGQVCKDSRDYDRIGLIIKIDPGQEYRDPLTKETKITDDHTFATNPAGTSGWLEYEIHKGKWQI